MSHSSVHIPVSLLFSQILCSSGACPAPSHAVPFTSLPGATTASHHLCQEEPRALNTGIYPPKFGCFLLPQAALWPIPSPDSPTAQQDTSCWCCCSWGKLNTPSTEAALALPRGSVSKGSGFSFLIHFALEAAHRPNCSTCFVHILPITLVPLGCRGRAVSGSRESSRADSSPSFPIPPFFFHAPLPRLRAQSAAFPHSAPHQCLM